MPSRQVITIRPEGSPSRFRQALETLRSLVLGPYNPRDPAIARLFGQTTSSTGISVSQETALNYAAVWAAVSLIADDIASLPLMLYRRTKNGGKDRYEDHPLYRVLHDRPNSEMTSFVFRRTLMAHTLTWGGGYAEIVRDNANRVAALWPITPDRVTPYRASPDAALQYRVTNGDSREVYFAADDILHIPGLGFDGVCGYSVIAKARESIGLGLAAERFGGTFFGNGSTFGGVLTFKNGDPGEAAKKSWREQMDSRHQGIDRAHKLLAVYADAKYERLGVPPNDAQFLETRTFQVREVARWFKIPPHKLADLADATFSNVEQQNLDYYTSCLRPWCEAWEQELERKLIAPSERRIQFIDHVTEDFLRADAAGRSQLESAHFNIGALTPNEARGVENRDPIKGGDRAFVPLNMMPIDRVDEWIDAQIEAKKPPPAPTPAPPTTEQVNSIIAAMEARCVDAALAVKLDTAVMEITALRTELHETRQRAAPLESENAALRSANERLTHQTEGLSLDVTVAQEALTAATERAAVLAETIEAQRLKLEASEAVAAELREQAKSLPGAREQIGRVETEKAALTAERDGARAELAEKVSDILALQDRIVLMTGAVKGVLVDKVQGILMREIDRARKAQATPEKLAKWIETFYPLHEEFCRDALKPALAAWAACVGLEQPEDVLDRWIARHLDESRQQLRAVVTEPDPDSYAVSLERILRRWETERADRTVARWMKEQAA